jgi:hypothetical protein
MKFISDTHSFAIAFLYLLIASLRKSAFVIVILFMGYTVIGQESKKKEEV